MLIRIIIILFIAGGVLIFMGVQDYLLISETSPEPEEIELTVIEKDPSLDNNYITIGPHIALYPAAIFEYEYNKWESDDYTETSAINYTLYPVISETHPFFEEIANLEAEYGTIDDIPAELWPEVHNIAVLIKTTEFKTVGDIPDSWLYEEAAQGIIINKIESLDREEKELMMESFPSADIDSVLLMDKDRVPGDPLFPYVKIGGGFILILAAIGIIIKTNQKDNAYPENSGQM